MKRISLFFLTLILVGCSKNEENAPPVVDNFEPINIVPTLISKRNTISPSVNLEEQKTIYSQTSNWQALINQIDSFYQTGGINFTATYFTETNIDFQSFTVIAVFDQIYGNGGHSIDITNIVEYETNIVVTVQSLQTGNTSSVVTQPYHIVKIPITTKPIVFEEL